MYVQQTFEDKSTNCLYEIVGYVLVKFRQYSIEVNARASHRPVHFTGRGARKP